jgi:hypothetical protein
MHIHKYQHTYLQTLQALQVLRDNSSRHKCAVYITLYCRYLVYVYEKRIETNAHCRTEGSNCPQLHARNADDSFSGRRLSYVHIERDLGFLLENESVDSVREFGDKLRSGSDDYRIRLISSIR